jgi:hypothetical protein
MLGQGSALSLPITRLCPDGFLKQHCHLMEKIDHLHGVSDTRKVFVETTTQTISILFVTLTLAASLITTQFIYVRRRRGQETALRDIPAYAIMPKLIGQGIESNRPLHLSLGSAGIGGQNTAVALAGAEMFYHLAEKAAIGDASPIVTLTDASALPLGQDTLRRAYQAHGLGERFKYRNVRWYPSGSRSLAFAAALTAMMGDDDVSANVLAGSFGPELALIMEAAQRHNLPTIAVSDQLEGQAVGYAMSDYILIGEEMFIAGAYLSDSPGKIAEAVTLDILRWVVIVGILYGVLVNSSPVFRQVVRTILGGG